MDRNQLSLAKTQANYLFEGEFRRRPIQNLAGASHNTPLAQFIQQAAEQRRARDDHRRQETSANVIQAHWRAYRCKLEQRTIMRDHFDKFCAQIDQTRQPLTAEQIDSLTGPLLLLHQCKYDHERLIWISQKILMAQDKVKQLLQDYPDRWLNRICKLLTLNLAVLGLTCTSNRPIATQLRLLEIFTSQQIYIPSSETPDSEAVMKSRLAHLWKSLTRANLFGILRKLVECKIPEPREVGVRPPSELAQSVADLLFQVLDCPTSDEATQCLIIRSFLCDFFTGPISGRVDKFFGPYLADKRPANLHPSKMVRVIHSVEWATIIHRKSGQDLRITQDQLLQMSSTDEYPNLVWLCYSIVQLTHKSLSALSASEAFDFAKLLRFLMLPARYLSEHSLLINEDSANLIDDCSYEDSTQHIGNAIRSSNNRQLNDMDTVISKIIQYLNRAEFVDMFLHLLITCERTNHASRQSSDVSHVDLSQVIDSIAEVGYLMLTHEPMAVFKCRFLHTLAFNPYFLRTLWSCITSVSSPSLFGAPTPAHTMIARGTNIGNHVWPAILPHLNLFCSLFSYLLPTLDDGEFYGTSDLQRIIGAAISSPESELSPERQIKQKSRHESMPFDLKTLPRMCAILRDTSVGLVQIIYQDYRVSHMRTDWTSLDTVTMLFANRLDFLFNTIVRAVRQLYLRDSRRRFCPEGHWISSSVVVPVNKRVEFEACANQRRRLFRHGVFRHQTREELETQGPLFTSNELRTALILQNMPFTVSFHDRVQILHALMSKDKIPYRTDAYHFGLPESSIQALIRRNYIYEDAFEKLSFNNEPDLKPPLRISLVNAVGLDEAGIDGGGVFKEFLGELLKTGFDPNRGFFKCTYDNLLYPNPSAPILFASLYEGFEVHYEFLGRMLGKAIYEKIMVELPFASFFLAKLLATQSSSDVDIHHLASLDPVLHKNLVYLKNYQGDVADLGLDFTIANNDLGENEVVELKPSGSKIPVTSQNRIEYVHLVADYRLNKQIRTQCAAFKKGLSQLLDMHWVRMFDPRELQILISGAPTSIDLDDLRRNTVYSGGYSDTDPVIQTFWRVVKDFDEIQKRKLLKFVTSCSLPPLLGFKDLVPMFSIHPAEPDRLPSASTCMNLLKLPKCEDEKTMNSKLTYSIEFNSGFELS